MKQYVINAFLQSVSNDLQPLPAALIAEYFNDVFIIELFEVERKLSNINVNKSSGPYHIPNWLLRDVAPPPSNFSPNLVSRLLSPVALSAYWPLYLERPPSSS